MSERRSGGRGAARWGAALLIGCAFLTAACGSSGKGSSSPNPNATEVIPPGDIPDNQVFVPYTAKKGPFSLRYPEGWARQQTNGVTTFSHDYNQIAVAATTQRTAPTVASVQSNYLVTLRPLLGFKLVKVDTVPRTAGTAVRIVYEVTSAPDRVTGKRVALDVERYLFWRGHQLLTVTLSTPHGSDNVDAWRTVTNSVAWK